MALRSEVAETQRGRVALQHALRQRHRPVEASGALLWLHDVFKVYRDEEVETVVLRGADLRVASGEFVAIVGRSGAGKSTLLNLIGGLDLPTAGQVVIDNLDLARLDESERAAFRRGYLGIVYQEANLIPFLSARENVALPLRLGGWPTHRAGERAAELLERLKLGQRLDHRPDQLSGGEVQRVAIAVALALQPALLLADELTGELDSETTEEVLDLLWALHDDEQLTLLVVTHSDRVARRAQRVVWLADGIVRRSEEGP